VSVGLEASFKTLNALDGTPWGARARRIFDEFSDAADFVWKAPSLIDNLTELEREKLATYFPLKGDDESDAFAIYLRTVRWENESRRLEHIFPRLMADGTFLAIVSLFEARCFELCLETAKNPEEVPARREMAQRNCSFCLSKIVHTSPRATDSFSKKRGWGPPVLFPIIPAVAVRKRTSSRSQRFRASGRVLH
jgi:hypothetical protein